MKTILNFEHRVARWLAQDYQQRVLRTAVQRAYADFAKRHPEWVAALFDKHFVQTHLLPLLVRARRDTVTVTPEQVARLWAKQFSMLPTQQNQHVAAVLPAATSFMTRVVDALAEVEEPVAMPAAHWLQLAS